MNISTYFNFNRNIFMQISILILNMIQFLKCYFKPITLIIFSLYFITKIKTKKLWGRWVVLRGNIIKEETPKNFVGIGERGMTDMFTTLTAVMVSQVKAYQILCLNGVCRFVLQLSSSYIRTCCRESLSQPKTKCSLPQISMVNFWVWQFHTGCTI